MKALDTNDEIDLLYRAVANPKYLEDFLTLLRQKTHSMAGSIQIDDRSSLKALTGIFQGYSDAASNSYVDYYSSKDVLKPHYLAHPDIYTRSITCEQLLDRREFRHSEFYADWIKPHGGYEYSVGTCLQDATNDRIINLTLQRDKTAGQFEQERALQHLNNLRPHLVSAMKALSLLDAAGAKDLKTAIHYLDKATFIVNDTLQAEELNPLAETFLNRHSWLNLDRQNRLMFPYSVADSLKHAVHTKIHPEQYPASVLSESPVIVHTDTAGQSYNIEVFPFYQESPSPLLLYSGQRLALLTITPMDKQLNPELLRQLFGFTPTELDIAVQIFQGFSIKQISQQTSRSELTIRSYLKTIYHKAGVNRQAELVIKIASGIAYR